MILYVMVKSIPEMIHISGKHLCNNENVMVDVTLRCLEFYPLIVSSVCADRKTFPLSYYIEIENTTI